MTGHIRKIEEGKYFVRISAGTHPITGKRIQKSLTVYGNRKTQRKPFMNCVAGSIQDRWSLLMQRLMKLLPFG